MLISTQGHEWIIMVHILNPVRVILFRIHPAVIEEMFWIIFLGSKCLSWKKIFCCILN